MSSCDQPFRGDPDSADQRLLATVVAPDVRKGCAAVSVEASLAPPAAAVLPSLSDDWPGQRPPPVTKPGTDEPLPTALVAGLVLLTTAAAGARAYDTTSRFERAQACSVASR